MKKTPPHFTARVEIERQISFFSFGFARVSEVRHIYLICLTSLTCAKCGIPSTLCWKIPNISGSIQLFAL